MSDNQFLNREQVVDLLKKAQGGKSQESFAADLDISQAFLSTIYKGTRGIPDAVAAYVGAEPAEKLWVLKKSRKRAVKRGK
jgi:hypothetical protein